VSVATTVKHSAGGQFVTHAAALPGNPYDGHTLATVIPQMQALIGNILDRCITDAGYRGHNAPADYKFKVYTAGQKRRVTPQIKREFKRRAAQASGDAINAVLAAAGYNFRRLLAWLRFCWGRLTVIERAGSDQSHGRDQSLALWRCVCSKPPARGRVFVKCDSVTGPGEVVS
jgi:transposase, IS5 family